MEVLKVLYVIKSAAFGEGIDVLRAAGNLRYLYDNPHTTVMQFENLHANGLEE